MRGSNSDAERDLLKVAVGHRPNGLAFDPRRKVLLAANVGDPAVPHQPTASIVDINARSMIASVLMPGRTRWAMFDEEQESFFVNIATPACIVAIDFRVFDRETLMGTLRMRLELGAPKSNGALDRELLNLSLALLFGTMACFRNIKQETYLCQDFEKRRPRTGYRGRPS